MFRFSPRTNDAHLIKWREWGIEAFHEAEQQNKLIVLFVTAFWCGFCQRMDETALSNEEVHAILNAFFIPIRVEESQRPDVDLRYNQNGWPTVAFLTPAGDHLFTVNYTETDEFTNLLVRLVSSFQKDPESVLQSASHAGAALSREPANGERPTLGPPIVAEISGIVEGFADHEHGGYGTDFKFLHTEANDFFLYLYETSGETSYLDHVRFSLNQIHSSKTYDRQDGGFFRYSSKPDWNEPHPEKLLEDQATLIRNYLHVYLLTDEHFYRTTAEGLINYLDQTLLDQSGAGFFGCQDYVRAAPVVDNVQADTPPAMVSIIDSYIYCDANAVTASAYLDAWWILGHRDCKQRAEAILDYQWQKLRATDGGMYHYFDGQPHVPGLLRDAVFTGLALLDAYAALHDETYLKRAKHVARDIVRMHRNTTGGFFDISRPGPGNLKLPIPVLTQNANAATFFVRLADLSHDNSYREAAKEALQSFPNAHRNYETFAAGYGHALARLLAVPLSITLAGLPGDPAVRELAQAAFTQLGRRELVLKFHEDLNVSVATAYIDIPGQPLQAITDPKLIQRDKC